MGGVMPNMKERIFRVNVKQKFPNVEKILVLDFREWKVESRT